MADALLGTPWSRLDRPHLSAFLGRDDTAMGA